MGMTEKSDIRKVKHILVALDTSPHSRAALEAAVALAESMDAELQGLFVEDINWFRITKRSFSYEISDLTGRIRSIESMDIEQEVRAQATRLRRLMDEMGKKSKIKYSFRTVRGGVEEEILTATESADLITLGRLGHSFRKHTELGKTAKTIIHQSRKPVLMLQQGWHIGNTNVAIYDGTDTSKKGLILAKQIAQSQGNRLLIVLYLPEISHYNERVEEIDHIFEDSEIKYQIRLMRDSDLKELNRLIKKQEGGLLIIPKNSSFLYGEKLEDALEIIQSPLLLFE